MEGYSVTPHPIIKKLNLTKYPSKLIFKQPKGYTLDLELTNCDCDVLEASYDLIIAFALTMDDMKELITQVNYSQLLKENGYLFIAYPKKGNKMYDTYVHRDEILPSLEVDEEGYIPNSLLKFSRMVSLDDTFTIVGLKYITKQQLKSPTKSQIASDYDHLVPDVINLLDAHEDERLFFKSLTPGYQRSWARFIFSAKQDATQLKRTDTMITCLKAGFKSHDLYRQSLK